VSYTPASQSPHLLEAGELQQLVDAAEPATKLVQVTSVEVFNQAHIAGAELVTPGELVCGVPPATGQLPTQAQLQQLFNRIGYNPEQCIVVYDDEGGGWAGRMAWTLDVIGHHNWKYLNGGLHAWHHAGLPLQQGQPQQSSQQAPDISINRQPIAELADVMASLDDPQAVVWDVRSADEYQGRRSAAARSGHIPGAVNLDWLLLQDNQHQQRITPAIEQRVVDLGIVDKRIITHCQTHHRSGLSYMLGRILDLDIRAYHGSWSEWGNRDDTPIEV